jgi:hypothetical protein
MQPRKPTFRSSTSASDWTPERVGQLRKPEIEQLRINAEALGAATVVALCDDALRALPKTGGRRSKA